ncbi:hypothetical protein WJX74_007767 [Apatococcus lobatus]|uniref:Uncharacterized protein n=1 Tax=Apatococcus lobatus TaxID=904363 RepID=A0AAW1SGP0_9CHLO
MPENHKSEVHLLPAVCAAVAGTAALVFILLYVICTRRLSERHTGRQLSRLQQPTGSSARRRASLGQGLLSQEECSKTLQPSESQPDPARMTSCLIVQPDSERAVYLGFETGSGSLAYQHASEDFVNHQTRTMG